MEDPSAPFQGILSTIQMIQRSQTDLYVHCSKVNSLIQSLRGIPVLLEQECRDPKAQKMSADHQKIQAVQSALDQISRLATQCSFACCARFILSTPIKTAKHEIAAIRHSLESAFGKLKLPRIAHEMKISNADLRAQNLVDMKRLTEILVKMSQQNRADAVEQISRRFKSLRKMHLKVDPSARTSLPIPDIPTNLNVLIKDTDVTIIREIARGESATVYLGTWQGREVAVKVVRLRVLSPTELESFRREIWVLANLIHPAILTLLAVTDVAPFYIVTEYLKNDSLFKFMRKTPERLTPTVRSLIAWDIARGLEFLHARGVIHRDMKSLNVLLTDDLRAKIADFGAVRLQLDTVATGSIGTMHWMAPEILISSPSYDFKVDVYSFGLVLWELLTGEILYPGMRPAQVTEFVLNGKRPELPPETPLGLATLIRGCWHADPKTRPAMTRVLAMLSDPGCHFADTDEAEFRAATGIVYHQRAKSQAPASRGRGTVVPRSDRIDFSSSDIEGMLASSQA
jgi:RIO-like serine/threonine protein kinase